MTSVSNTRRWVVGRIYITTTSPEAWDAGGDAKSWTLSNFSRSMITEIIGAGEVRGGVGEA